jgi:hypothetical protein
MMRSLIFNQRPRWQRHRAFDPVALRTACCILAEPQSVAFAVEFEDGSVMKQPTEPRSANQIYSKIGA